MKLSILICHLENRKESLKKLQERIFSQIDNWNEIEMLINSDNGKKSIGQKRNELLQKAKGDYIVFIDDDDLVSEDYISKVLEGIQKNPDAIGIELVHMIKGKYIGTAYHSIKYKTWYQEKDSKGLRYYRNPNHLNPVKREFALKVGFPQINFAEDFDYSKRLLPYLKTEYYIDKPIYYYLE